MNTSIETIYHNTKPVAMIIPAGIHTDGITYVTDPLNPLQIGLHNRPKGMKLAPHVHTVPSPVTLTEFQEVLFIISGSIELTLYTKTGDCIAKRILKNGDSALLMREGHMVEYMEDTHMYEVKQGPYPGSENAKIYIKTV